MTGFRGDDEENRVNTTPAIFTTRARRSALLALMAGELLYLLTSGILFRVTLNQGLLFIGGSALSQLALVGLPSIVAFILPSAIGAIGRGCNCGGMCFCQNELILLTDKQ